ncbi:MAG: Zn-ribbon domain-containing OB-fold protein [Syntrophomonadales bacterium]|jgi:uncharacterized OB-fold protein
MSEITYQLPPRISDDTAPFWQGCRERHLLFQRCSACGHIRYPISFICPECLSSAHEWVESQGKGKIYSYVVFRRAFHPAVLNRVPYVVAVVELDEGPSFLTNIVDCRPEQVECDQKVSLKWEDSTEGLFLPVFCINDNQD